ncbi:transporter substrate-binding domain-containing protein [Anaerosporobacter sp.]
MKNKLVFTGLIVAMAVSCMACSSKKESNELVMATNAEFPPYEYLEGSDFRGIDVEIAQAIADDLGKELVIEDMAFDSVITSVQSGKADIGLAGLTVNEDRLKNVDFSDTYTTARQVIITKKGSDIKTVDDLEGKLIGVQLGTTGDIYAEDVKDATVERYNKGFEAVQALSQGKIDVVIIDNEPAKVFASQNEEIEILEEEFRVEEYAIAVKKGNDELVKQINESLNKLEESGELQEIIDKYINKE